MAERLGAAPIRQFRAAGVSPRDLFVSQFDDEELHSYEEQHRAAAAASQPSSGQPSSSAAHEEEPPVHPPPPPGGPPTPFRIPKRPAPAPATAAPATTEVGTAGGSYPATEQLRSQLRSNGVELSDRRHDKQLKATIAALGLESLRAEAARERRLMRDEAPWKGRLGNCKQWLATGDCSFGLLCCNIHDPAMAGTDPSAWTPPEQGGGGRGNGRGSGKGDGRGGGKGDGRAGGKGGGGKGDGHGGGRARK